MLPEIELRNLGEKFSMMIEKPVSLCFVIPQRKISGVLRSPRFK